eukprot:CAMPEP_0202686252 /NCGR_PEP_ID=MMETSP1385-20130828/2060_1 /ASSEMBLY_ACC=CAM_ASM_000861 /TAXON_ID=933848 /ORGANISM="Elphidium margaritaceum" /LENGTH=518 /DNA_ID=CAMNT_0049340785 /DNA_START=42 /DNA_END=1595 /DNA_ORIENTATION=-
MSLMQSRASSSEPMNALAAKHVRSLDDDVDANQILPICSNKFAAVAGTPSYQEYVANNLLGILDDEQVSDVVFEVEDEHFYGIRALFASHSIVFRRMLYGGMLESDPSNHVVLTDITVPAFKYLRSTFYNVFNHERATDLQCDMVVDVLFAAHKYLIEPLIAKCIDFIKRISNMRDWFLVLQQFENSQFQYQASLFLSQILNQGSSPYILQNKSAHFLQNEQFKSLKSDLVLVLIRSDFLAAKERDVWDSLIKWCRHNAVHMARKTSVAVSEDREQKEELEQKTCQPDSDSDLERNLTTSERALMANFIQHVRFKRMDGAFFKQHIVDNQILSESQVIQVMFAREDATKWRSEFNDRDRQKCKLVDAFDLSEVCLTLAQIEALSVGDVVDFRDHYGLFCAATIIETDHSSNRVKIHYNHWGTTYDEWYTYKLAGIVDDDDANNDRMAAAGNDAVNDGETHPDRVRLTQKDLCSRFARFGSITKRSIKRKDLKDRIEHFHNNATSEAFDIQIKPSKFFW